MGRLDYSIELPQRTIQDVQMPNLPDHLTYIEPGYGIGDMLAEIAKNIRAGKLAQVEENLKMAQAQNYQAEMADRQSRAAREQQELIDTRSAQQKLADLLNTPGAITNPELRAPLIAAFSRLGGAGANLAQATFGASDRERLQDQRFVGQGVLQGERLDAQRGMQSERIGAQQGMQSERLDAQADIANLRDATTRRGQDMTQAGADRRFQPRPITDQQGNVFVSPQGVGNTAAQPMMVGGGAPAVPSRLPDSGPLRGMNTGAATGRPTDGEVDLTGPLSPPTTPTASPSQELRQLNVGVKGKASESTEDYILRVEPKINKAAESYFGTALANKNNTVQAFLKQTAGQEEAAFSGNIQAQRTYDKSLVQALAKLTDPDSVIRESEIRFQNELGLDIWQKMQAWKSSFDADANVVLRPEVRMQMRKQLEDLSAFWENQDEVRRTYVRKRLKEQLTGSGRMSEDAASKRVNEIVPGGSGATDTASGTPDMEAWIQGAKRKRGVK